MEGNMKSDFFKELGDLLKKHDCILEATRGDDDETLLVVCGEEIKGQFYDTVVFGYDDCYKKSI